MPIKYITTKTYSSKILSSSDFFSPHSAMKHLDFIYFLFCDRHFNKASNNMGSGPILSVFKS